MSVKDFWLVNEGERRELSAGIESAFSRWHEEWSATMPGTWHVQSADTAVVAKEAYRWLVAVAENELLVALGIPSNWGLESVFVGAEVRDTKSTDIAHELEAAALRALLQVLLEELKINGVVEPAFREHIDISSGETSIFNACCSIAVGATPIMVKFYSPAMSMSLPRSSRPAKSDTALTTVRRALESHSVCIEVIVGEAELMLQEIRSLTAGDVIPLDRCIDDPLKIVFSGDGAVGAGYLGISDDRKAVQLTLGHV